MAGTYEQKRAELEALATGGIAGRDAYRAGQQRIVTDQRAAIDRALGAVPTMTREAGTNDFLESIIRPAGDAAAARMDFAGDRFDTSMGTLDSALDRALAQQSGARDLNYNRRLEEGRLATDRSMNLAREQDALAERRRKATEQDYTEAQRQAIGAYLGGIAHEQDKAKLGEAQRRQAVDELLSIASRAFGDLDPTLQTGLLEQVWANQDNPAEIANLVQKYSPAYALEAESAVSRASHAVTNVGRALVGEAPRTRDMTDRARAEALERALAGFTQSDVEREQAARLLDTRRSAYNAAAFGDYFGDPLLGAALYPQTFKPVQDAIDSDRALEDFVLYGPESERQEAQAADQQAIAGVAGVSAGQVNKVAGSLDMDPISVYEVLADPDVAAVIADAVDAAAADAGPTADGVDRRSNAEIKRAMIQYVSDNLPAGVSDEYRLALAAIAREQFEAIYGGD